MKNDVINFWFNEIDEKQWWIKDTSFDQLIATRFAEIHQAANHCELFSWRETPKGRLAEIIVLDQFSRNIYRNTPQAFASDALALALSQHAIELGIDKSLTAVERSFLYMPFMHSESAEIHRIAVDLYQDNGNKGNLDFEFKHQAIIDKFGRYPHRNEILGRISTAEELKFLQQPNSSF